FDESTKFTTRESNHVLFGKMLDFLDQVAMAEGYIYKDVIHPFVLAEWRGLQQFRVLKIKRELPDIAYSMLRAGWFYPQNASSHPRSSFLLEMGRRLMPFRYSGRFHSLFKSQYESAVIEGLIVADRVLDQIPGVTLDYNDLIADES